MVQHPPAGRHSRCRDDDAGKALVVDRARFADVVGLDEAARIERIAVAVEIGLDLVAVYGDGGAVDAEGRQSHRAVDVDREVGDPALSDEPTQLEQDDLGPVDGEGRDHDGAAAPGGTDDGILECRERRGGRMPPVTVGRLDDDHVRVGRRRGVAQERVVPAAEVAAHDQAARRLAGDSEGDARGAQDVPRPRKPGGDAIGDLDLLVEAHRAEALQRDAGVGLRVEREGRGVLREPLAVGVGRVLLLEMPTVGEDDPAQLLRRRRSEDGAAVALLHQGRQVARVVDVGVGQHHRVDRFGGHGELAPVAKAQRLLTLEQAAVDEHPRPRGVEQEAASGDGPRRAEEAEDRHRRSGNCRDRRHRTGRYSIRPAIRAAAMASIASIRRSSSRISAANAARRSGRSGPSGSTSRWLRASRSPVS